MSLLELAWHEEAAIDITMRTTTVRTDRENPLNFCIFCGSSFGRGDHYKEAAGRLGGLIAARGHGLVYGGASVGLMGAVADGALQAGGNVIGVLPEALASLEIAHPDLTDLKIVSSMHERKAMMAELSDAFIALPGGIGTLEEAFEIWTWTQLGLHRKPLGLLNVEGFYDKLSAFLDQLVEEQFVRPAHRQILLMESDPDRLIDGLIAHELPASPKIWIDRGSA